MEIKKIAEELYVLGLKRHMKELSEAIKKAEKEEDENKVTALQETLSILLKKLSKKEDFS